MIAWWKRNWWWVAGLVVALAKVSLLRSQHIYAIGGTIHDDALFANLATNIVRGEWLGAYDQLTLSKGPAYPLFIAVNFWIGMPLALTQQLLYVTACFIVVWAIAPWVKHNWARFLIVSFLALNPLTYEGASMTRLLRQHLTVPLAMVAVAGILAVVVRRDLKWGERWPWALLSGCALGWFWLSREEGIWILPFYGMSALALGVHAWRKGRPEVYRFTALMGIVLVAGYAPIWAISAKNHSTYGWFGTVDFRASEFQDVIGALTRVEVGPERPYVQVNREAREAIYAVSPAFAELRPHLEEGPIAAQWMEKEAYPYEDRQYMTGWFNWALRDAIALAGHMETPTAFLAYCERLAEEVNAACDAGELPGGAERSGFLPRWNPAYGEAMKASWKPFFSEALSLSGFVTIVPSSQGTDDDIRAFVDLSYDNLSPSHNATYFHKPDQLDLNRFKLDTLRDMGNGIKDKYRWVFIVAAGLLVVRLVERLIRRRWSWVAVMSLAVLAAAVAELVLNFLVHTMAFTNMYPAVFAPAYPLMQLAAVLVVVDVAQGWIAPAWREGRVWALGKWNARKSGVSSGA